MLAGLEPMAAESVLLAQSAGRVLAADVAAAVDLPRFDNSAMDGYAVIAAEAGSGAQLQCVGEVPAGSAFENALQSGQCLRIFTGSPLPVGANAVVMQEDTRVEADRVEITEGVKPFEHIRLRGEDVKEGEPIERAGEVMHAGRLQLLGAAGVAGWRCIVGRLSGCWPRGMNCANRVRLWARAAFMRATGACGLFERQVRRPGCIRWSMIRWMPPRRHCDRRLMNVMQW